MPDITSLTHYLERYFLSQDQFTNAANISLEQFNALIKAKAMPGPIYKLWENGAVWSPIGGQHGNPDFEQPVSTWYTYAALWPARQAKIVMERESLSPDQVAAMLEREFAEDFRAAVLATEARAFEYQSLFNGPDLDKQKLLEQSQLEWQSWIDGGYAVCLRRWDGAHPVAKNVEIARIRVLTDGGKKPAPTATEQRALLKAIKRLDEVMLPFAPYQRPLGSPGKWVDQILAKYGLGHIPLTTGGGASVR